MCSRAATQDGTPDRAYRLRSSAREEPLPHFCPDNVCTVVLPRLCRQYANGRYQVYFEFHPWQSGIAELVEHGQLDLVLHIDDGLLPSHFQSERLYRAEWICAVAHER